MKRRNGDCAKLRRQVRKANKSLDDTYDSMIFILKTLAFWMMTFTVDHFLNFRLEFFWPLWYLARNINSSYKYQGLGLSFVFVCVAFTSDVLCYFFIPVQYLFFAASTWVWVHYIYNNERGLTASTLILYFIIILLESSVKFKPEHRHTLNINLCKPFAAHCIGFPLVTFSFSEIRNCYFSCSKATRKSSQDLFSSFDGEAAPKTSQRKSTDSQDKDLTYVNKCHKLQNGTSVEECTEYTSSKCNGGRNDATSSNVASKKKSHHHSNHSSNNSSRDESCSSTQYKQQVELTLNLEREVKQLRSTLQSSRSVELELRSSLANLVAGERNARSELSEVQQENQELNVRLQSLLTARALDKQSLSALEKRLADEKKLKAALETLLSRERKGKEAGSGKAAANKSLDCSTDTCRMRRREMEADNRRERESSAQTVSRLREEHTELEHRLTNLRKEVSLVQDRNQALERSLSAETRIKLDLFSALGEAKRENEIVETKLRKRDQEMSLLQTRMAQVLAVMPTSGFTPLLQPPSSASKLLVESHLLPSNLDPNAIAYTPKQNGHLVMEA